MKLFSLKNIPLTIIVGFNLFTLLVFYTAPIDWRTDNMFVFLLFVVWCQLMIIWGYKVGSRKEISSSVVKAPFFFLTKKKLNFIFLFYFLTFLIKYAYLLRFQVLDVGGMFKFLSLGLADQQVGYKLSIDSSRPYTVNWGIYFITSVINQVFFIIGFIKWREMSKQQKNLFIFFVAVEIFYWLGRGTNFGIITIVTTFAFSVMSRLKAFKLNIKRILLLFTILITVLIATIAIFSSILDNRRGNSQLDYQQFNMGISTVNEHSVVFSIIPRQLQDTYMYVMSYLSQGYYSATLALDLDYNPTYFCGSNPAVINLALFFGVDVWKDTYMYRLREKGIDPLINWHSAYVWYANDVTFIGVPFLLFAIAYITSISWKLSIERNDFLSKIIFTILCNMLLFLFANNTYLSSVFYSFMFILPIWYFSRIKKYRLT